MHKRIVEIGIMRYKHPVFQQIKDVGSHFIKGRRRCYHLVAYAGHVGYKRRNRLVGVNERFIDTLYLVTVM